MLQQPVSAFQKIVSQQRLDLRRLSVQLVANIDILQINRLILKPKLQHPHIGKPFILRSTDTGNFSFVICNVREPGIPRGTEDGAGMQKDAEQTDFLDLHCV